MFNITHQKFQAWENLSNMRKSEEYPQEHQAILVKKSRHQIQNIRKFRGQGF